MGFVEEKRLIHLPLAINCRLNMSEQTVDEEEDYISAASSGEAGCRRRMKTQSFACNMADARLRFRVGTPAGVCGLFSEEE